MAKKSELKRVNNKLDKTWSILIRSAGACEYCCSVNHLQAHHIFGRRNQSTRWDLNNGICLCPGCHTFSNDFSAHQTPTTFTEWIIERRGEAWHDELKLKAHSSIKMNLNDKKELLAELEDML